MLALPDRKLIHLADFPIPPNNILDCFWDDNNYDRITEVPFDWIDTREYGYMNTAYNNIYGEQVLLRPLITLENNSVKVTIYPL